MSIPKILILDIKSSNRFLYKEILGDDFFYKEIYFQEELEECILGKALMDVYIVNLDDRKIKKSNFNILGTKISDHLKSKFILFSSNANPLDDFKTWEGASIINFPFTKENLKFKVNELVSLNLKLR